MHIVCHRGLWGNPSEQNSLAAFKRALTAGFGLEADIRDRSGEVVISHEMANRMSPSLKQLLRLYRSLRSTSLLALNIKADGLERAVNTLLKQHAITRYFAFDMSIPTAFRFFKYHRKVVTATRHSDMELQPVLYRHARWVWLDELQRPWIQRADLEKHHRNGKKICIVSPELHRRPHKRRWAAYKALPQLLSRQLYLCTDHPCEADRYFNSGGR